MEKLKKMSPYLMFAAAWALIAAAVLLGERVPKQVSLVLFTLGGVLLGFGAVGIALSRIRLSPEQQKEYERGEHDERNVAIREKAAMSSWYWTLYMLWAAFMVIQIFVAFAEGEPCDTWTWTGSSGSFSLDQKYTQ